MRVLLQRVSQASVSVDGQVIGQIGRGHLVYLGVMAGDSEESLEWLTNKVCNIRLFEGDDGKINDRSVLDIDGEVLVISQFTLAGKLEKGNRPDFTGAADPGGAEKLYTKFIQKLLDNGLKNVQTGQFGAFMQVESSNEGPCTLLLER